MHIDGTRAKPPRAPANDDEMTFSGVNRTAEEIPSKAFQRLQNITGGAESLQSVTGGAEIDTSSIRPGGSKHHGTCIV